MKGKERINMGEIRVSQLRPGDLVILAVIGVVVEYVFYLLLVYLGLISLVLSLY